MTSLLPSDAELTALRDDIEAALFADTCNVLSVTTVPNGAGGYTETWGTATADIACRLAYVRGVKLLVGGALQSYTGYLFTLPHDTSLSAANRIEKDGGQYTVTAVDDAKTWNACLRVAVEKVGA